MISFSDRFSGKEVTLLGFGRSSAALLDTLLAAGARITVRDRATAPRLSHKEWEARGVHFLFGDGWLSELSEPLLVRSPAVRPDLPEIQGALARGATLTSECELFCEACPATVLAVTGSDGKTTTATLAATLLRAAVEHTGARVYLGGNNGTPLFPRLCEMTARDFAVLELSSFQLMGDLVPPARAVITNISENHLNWHHGMEEYVAAKKRILGRDTHAVLSADNPYTAEIAIRHPRKTVFSATQPRAALVRAYPQAATVTVEGGCVALDGRALLSLSDIRLVGRHNLENYMAALGLIALYTRDVAPLSSAARAFLGVAHRLEEVARVDGVRYIDSSIDSTPTRTAAALSAMGRVSFLLCGGRGKGLSLDPLRAAIVGRVGTLIVFGECRDEIATACFGYGGRILSAPTLREATGLAMREARAGETVLLSPACTSFDEFADFEERGAFFRRTVLGSE